MTPIPLTTGKAATMTGEATFWRMEAERHAGEPQCEADGVRNGPDGPGGTEHYWSCTAPGTVDVDGTLMCDDHAGERGYGPKQEEYGFDPDDGLAPGAPVTEEG